MQNQRDKHLHSPKKNIIIAAATGYDESAILPFMESVKEHCIDTNVYLIVYETQKEIIDILQAKFNFTNPYYIDKKLGSKYFKRKLYKLCTEYLSKNKYSPLKAGYFNKFLGFVGRQKMHISVERYFIALEILRTLDLSAKNVMLTDIRDVLIQRNPFDIIEDNIITGLEPEIIGRCKSNSYWIEQLYGKQTLSTISNNWIACSGVTIGSIPKIKNYLTYMCSEIWKKSPIIIDGNGFDQGIHNYLIINHKIHIETFSNEEGVIVTLAHENIKNLSRDSSGLVQVYDKIPYVVHQYDRLEKPI